MFDDGQNRISNLSVPRLERTLGMLLLESGKLTLRDIETIERNQKILGLRFGEVAVRLGMVSQSDVSRMLAVQFGYPYLQAGEGEFSPELITAYDPFSFQAEVIKNLRSELRLRYFDGHQRTLAIFGTGRRQGCSFLAANLAVAFAQLGERTLLIDADLRRPRQQEYFNLGGTRGLSDLLAGRSNVLHKIRGFPCLSVLPAGTLAPNPQELLGRPTFPRILREFAEAYDVVLLDSPSAEYYADVQQVLALAGAGVMVARRHQTRLENAMAMKQKVLDAGAQIVGVVLNEF